MGHAVPELEGVVNVQEEMQVIGSEDVGTDADLVLPLGPAEDAKDDVLDLLARAKEETAVEGSAGDLDYGPAFGDKA